MTRKQSAYLDDLLADNEPAPDPSAAVSQSPSPAPADRPRGMPLLARESALARIASGEVRQITQLLLDPARVRIWAGNARTQRDLSEENCRDLIDSIMAEGGQKVPAIVRRVEGDPSHDYEVIAGTRRHWAVSWLRRNNYPDFMFLAQVHVLDDEAAFRLADLENRARRDICDLERARNYAVALSDYYGGVQARMAERLRVSKGWLSKMLTVARLPEAVVAVFATPADILLKPAYPLAQALEDKAAAKLILAEARRMTAERAAGAPALPAGAVINRLLAVTRLSEIPGPVYQRDSSYGRALLTIQSINRQGISVRLHHGSGANAEEAVAALREALTWLEGEGRGLQK